MQFLDSQLIHIPDWLSDVTSFVLAGSSADPYFGAAPIQCSITSDGIEHAIHPTQTTLLKKQLKEKLKDFFTTGKPAAAADEKLTKQLFQKIGNLEMELDWLKKSTTATNKRTD